MIHDIEKTKQTTNQNKKQTKKQTPEMIGKDNLKERYNLINIEKEYIYT